MGFLSFSETDKSKDTIRADPVLKDDDALERFLSFFFRFFFLINPQLTNKIQ